METILRPSVAVVLGLVVAASVMAADPNTVRGDFDGDGTADEATLFQHERHVTLVVRRSSAAAPETFEFRVDPAAQDAICTLPAKLSTSPSFCAPMDEQLPGCTEAAGKVDLSISDDACDAIHLYWDGDAERIAWWRL